MKAMKKWLTMCSHDTYKIYAHGMTCQYTYTFYIYKFATAFLANYAMNVNLYYIKYFNT